MRVIIAGAGIGGLTCALSLHAAGIEALVVEAVADPRPLGVGINLLPHAVRELTELGLAEDVAAVGVPTAEFVHFDRHGGRIWGEPRGRALGYRWPQYSVHRGRLQMMLLAAVRDRLGDAAVRTGTEVTGFTQDRRGVRVQISDRRDGTAGELTGDVLVGADGLHSRVRALLHPGEPAPLWNGVRMWRGVTMAEPFLTGRSLAVAGSNRAAKFVAYPIGAPDDRGLVPVNWVAEVMFADERLTGYADWNHTGRTDDVLPHFADWKFDWLDVPGLIRGADRILEYPMVDRDPLPRWGEGRVTLLGDAAHPLYPIGSNGGSQAVIDARVLAYELARAAEPEHGLTRYEEARREFTSALVLANRDMPADRVLHMVGERAPDGFERIEDVLTAEELATITGAYTSTTGTDVETLNSRPSWSVARG